MDRKDLYFCLLLFNLVEKTTMISAAVWSGSGNTELARMGECAEVQVILPTLCVGLGMVSIILMQ